MSYRSDVSLTPAPPPKRRGNIRTLRANRIEYLLENYPPDIDINKTVINPPGWWSEVQVKRAMQAAYDAGRRDQKKLRED